MSSNKWYLAYYSIGVFLFLNNEFGSTLRLDVFPETFHTMITDEINLTCYSYGPAYWAHNVVTLEILKNGQKPIAVVSHEGLVEGLGMAGNMKAEGHVESDASKSYIRVTIKNPGIPDTGTYTCLMFYMDETLNMKELKADANVTVANEDITHVMTYLMRRLSDLEKSIERQGDVISQQSETIRGQQRLLKDQNDTIERLEKLLKGYTSGQEYVTKTAFSSLQDSVTHIKTSLNETNNMVVLQNDTLFKQEVKLKDQEWTQVYLGVKLKDHEDISKDLKESTSAIDNQLTQLKESTSKRKNEIDNQLTQLKESTSQRKNEIDNKLTQLKESASKRKNEIDNKLTQLKESASKRQSEIDNQLTQIKESRSKRQSEIGNQLTQLKESTSKRQSEIDNQLTQLKESTSKRHSEIDNQITQLKESTSKRKSEIDNQLTQLKESTSKRHSEIDNQLTQLKESTSKRKSEIDNQLTQLKESTIKKHSEIGNQLTQLKLQQSEMQKLNTKVASRVTVLEDTEIKQSQSIMELIKNDSFTSAFSALLSSKTKVSTGQILKFTNVQENIGDNYDPATGIYTAPIDGLYTFQLTAMSFARPVKNWRETNLEIVANNVAVARINIDHIDKYDQSSMSCVVKLQAGNTVKCLVRYISNADNRLYGTSYTGFSGYLIKPL